ncbi:hypothetical protein VPH35_002299 [Triticum aestivum]
MEIAVAALTLLFLSHLSGLLGLIVWWRRGVIGLLSIRHHFINSQQWPSVRPFCSCESVDPAHAHDLAEAGAARSNSTRGQSIAARGKWRDAGDASRRFI